MIKTDHQFQLFFVPWCFLAEELEKDIQKKKARKGEYKKPQKPDHDKQKTIHDLSDTYNCRCSALIKLVFTSMNWVAYEYLTMEISHGKIRGVRNEGVNIFKGVPNAGRISGDRRFRQSCPSFDVVVVETNHLPGITGYLV